MPDLSFRMMGVEAAERGLTPLLNFQFEVTNTPIEEHVQGALVQTQIQIQCPQRTYREDEKEKLVELFGAPERWGQTLRNRLWTHATMPLRPFRDRTIAILPVPCSFDLNLSATKYLYALEEGDAPLLFLFSGTVFYSTGSGRLQAQQISWEKECSWRMPVQIWRELMEHHWPNTAWLTLRRDVFERIYEFRRQKGFSSWEQTLERLLADAVRPGEAVLDSQS
ncbi:MAG TPA: DUF6084 family protein [Chthoniobacteraceae bacterium]|jgi:hypothetical protein